MLAPLADDLARPLRELRISVIDRCNFRCTYCMPKDSLNGKGKFLTWRERLSDREIEQLVRAFVKLGVAKVRITGGEPLLRPGLTGLIERLAVFATMTGNRGSVAQVLKGIEAAGNAGFNSLKINTVVQRGVNDHTVMDLVRHFRGSGHILRLIEFMDVGNSNHWSRSRVVSGSQWLERISKQWPLRQLSNQTPGETANRYAFEDGAGEIGLINSITQSFCGTCSRARVTADGAFHTCLFSSQGIHLRPLLRNGSDPLALEQTIRAAWSTRRDQYSNDRLEQGNSVPRVEMYRVGG